MSRYLKKIVEYFFHHDVDEEHRKLVYRRMAEADESHLDKIFDEIWNELPQDSSQYMYDAQPIGVRRRRYRAWFKIAAIWVVPLCLTALAALMFFSSGSHDDGVPLVQHYARIGSVEKIILPDSTEVWLNAGSVIVYPDRYNDRERYAYIYGEGFFNVMKDADRPFTVKTENLDITVLGTSFNVNSFPGSVENTVTLETGKINVKLPDDRSFVLSPDERLVYNSINDRFTVQKVSASAFSSWRDGELFLCDLPFDEALSRIGRAYGVKPLIRNSIYNKEQVHVRFNNNEPIENVMSILQNLVPGMRYVISDSTIIIE